ncbi:MAG: PEGA domain-containing protein [Myxococcota bacterium]
MSRYIRHLAAFALAVGLFSAPVAAHAHALGPGADAAQRITPGSLDAGTSMWSAKRRKKRRRKKKAPSPAEERFDANLPKPPDLGSAKGRRRVALLPIQAIEIPDALLAAIEANLLTEIDEVGGLVAVSPEDVRREVEVLANHGFSQPFTAESCNGNTRCLATAGRFARAHLALDTRVSGVGGTVKLAMRLFDTVAKREQTRVAEVVSETDSDERARQIHRMAVQLLQPKTYVGSLNVECDEEGAEIYLNDELVGTTPLKGKLQGLSAGPYILKVSKDGFNNVYQFVDVVYRRVSTYQVSLNQNTIASTLVEVESERGFGELYLYSQTGEFELRIDGDPRGRVELGGTPVNQVAAGERRLSLRWEGGQPLVQPVKVEPGKRTDLVIEPSDDGFRIVSVNVSNLDDPLPQDERLALAPVDTPQELTEARRERSWRWTAGLVAGGLGVVGLGAGAFFSDQVASLDQEARDLEAGGPYEEGSAELIRAAQINDEGASAESNQRLAYVAGAVLVAAGAGLILWDLTLDEDPASSPAPEPPSTITVRAAPTRGGGFFGLGFDF